PAHAVNDKSANFYVSGLNGGVGCVRGHFATAGFLIDINRQVVSRSPESFLDKPWMTVDSLSGNVYFSWSNFVSYGGVSRIELQRFDANLEPIGPRLLLSDTSVTSCGSQFSQISTGPNGEVLVSWQQLDCATGQTLLFV